MAKEKKVPGKWAKDLRLMRARLGLKRTEAAERAGVSLRTWIAWENRQRTPGRIAQRLLKTAFPTEF